MHAKLNSESHLWNTFFDFLSLFLCVWLKSLQKVQKWPQKFFFSNNYHMVIKKKPQNLMPSSNSVEKVQKSLHKESYRAENFWTPYWKVKKFIKEEAWWQGVCLKDTLLKTKPASYALCYFFSVISRNRKIVKKSLGCSAINYINKIVRITFFVGAFYQRFQRIWNQ
jgi:hypothetical protein